MEAGEWGGMTQVGCRVCGARLCHDGAGEVTVDCWARSSDTWRPVLGDGTTNGTPECAS